MSKNLVCGLLILTVASALLRAQPSPPPPLTVVSLSNTYAPAVAAATTAAATTTNLGPRIRFATTVGDFGLVRNGETVKYTFIFTNVGDQVLRVSNVVAGCHCTTPGDWTRAVEPGETGKIPLQLDTANFNGPVMRFISISCNDKTQAAVGLQLKGSVWRPLDVIPPFVNMTVLADATNASCALTITNRGDEPVALSAPQCTPAVFVADLKTNLPGKLFGLDVRMTGPQSPGIVQGQITVKTSMTNPAVLTVPIWVNVQPPLLVMPQQIMLPQAPLAAKQLLTVSIQNATTNSMILSEPAVNAPGVDVQIREVLPGRNFSVLLNFPEGFEIPKDQSVQFTVKSSLPKFPLIKVPVTQSARPGPSPAPSAASPAQPGAAKSLPPSLPLPSRAAAQ